jgi:predicted GH43/DUF377 family glycosyl hydrolase
MSVVQSHPLRIRPNPARVVIRHFQVAGSRWPKPDPQARVRRIVEEVQAMDTRTIQSELSLVLGDFENRHREVRQVFEERYDGIAQELGLSAPLHDAERALIGAYFCNEYSFESAALMNPSVVPHPDQSGLGERDLRFLLSLRAVGEGHISSITFREGLLTAEGDIRLSEDSHFAVAARPDTTQEGTVCLTRHPTAALDETVLFPVTAAQRNGLEDLRLLRFEADGEPPVYYGTYTAYSGTEIASELLVTRDFQRFEMHPLSGPAAQSKGMALFPRRIDGGYAMIGRPDNENLFLLRSDNLFHWEDGTRLAGPVYPWELVQIGNCGAAIEIDQGWLVLTHGVGAMRKYAVGAMLLDKNDPARVLGRSRVPLLSPSDAEREGYVPNVVYTCGALVHAGLLLLPYGVADSSVAFATVKLTDLLATLE